MKTSFILDEVTPAFSAINPTARFWSRRVIAVNCLDGISGALAEAIRAFVLHGLPTVMTLTFRDAAEFIALP